MLFACISNSPDFSQVINNAPGRPQVQLLHGAGWAVPIHAENDLTAQSWIDDPGEHAGAAAGVETDGSFDFPLQRQHGSEAFGKVIVAVGPGNDLNDIGASLLQKESQINDLRTVHRNTGMAGKKHLRALVVDLSDEIALAHDDFRIGDDLFGVTVCKGIRIVSAKTRF